MLILIVISLKCKPNFKFIEEILENRRNFFLSHSSIECLFSHDSDNFFVEEVPLYDFSGSGEHLVVNVRKKNISTLDMLGVFAQITSQKPHHIGYAGLKDKNAMAIQNISVHRSLEPLLENFSHPKIKILNTTYHNNKLKIGHLKGNRFFIRLKKVSKLDATKIANAISEISRNGMPNFFGYQRFGKDGLNAKRGKDFLAKNLRRKSKIDEICINAYQSALFNNWLSDRIELSHLLSSDLCSDFDKKKTSLLKKQAHFFTILQGDVMSHYPFGKLFYAQDLESEAQKFSQKDRVVTGILSGSCMKAQDDALLYEQKYDEITKIKGSRRFAWVFPEIIHHKYIPEQAHYELKFFLPKGSYATSLIEELLHRKMSS